MFIDVLNNAYDYYKKSDYVQKGKIAEILFLNIQLHKKKLQVKVKP